jgi:hypothetical protein
MDKVEPRVVAIASVPPIPAEEAPTKARIGRLIMR